jgi:lysophospholipase L1-like esterase
MYADASIPTSRPPVRNRFWRLHYWTLLLPALFVPNVPHPAQAGTSNIEQDGRRWIGTWATAPQPFLPGSLQSFHQQTLRLIVHTSAGGTRVRVRISNTYGDRPLDIGGAHIARRTTGASIDSTSDRTLTFRGRSTTSIPARSLVVSDPVALDVPALSDLAVSLFLPSRTAATTSHALALETSYFSTDIGNFTAVARFPGADSINSWPFLTGVDVEASPNGVAIVAFGSSTTDGDGTTSGANRRWPDILAERLQGAAVRKGEVGVLNQGIIGNRLLEGSPLETRDRFGAALGESGLTRFERDVLAQPGVGYVILCLGINDISFPGVFTPASERVRAQDLIAGYRRLMARARERRVKLIMTTIPPFEGARSYTPEKELVRQEINAWIRGSVEFDAVVDFDATLRDPTQPTRLDPAFDSGDHLHANDAGHAATANAIPLSLFQGQ